MRKPKETVADVGWLIQEWDYEENEPLGLSPDRLGSQSNVSAFWKCKYGHKWQSKISNRYNGRGCPDCAKGLKTSFPEQAVFFYVKKVFPDAINSFKADFLDQMELDIFIPSERIAIEYDGIAWHKDDTLWKEKRKYEMCKQNGITLFRLKENAEHVRNQQDLGFADRVLFVRRPFKGKPVSYLSLDLTIRALLYDLGDGDLSVFMPTINGETRFINPIGLDHKIRTDVNTKRDRNYILENYFVNRDKCSLEAQYPEVAKYWHPTKNGNLKPAMFLPHTAIKVWWIGECGHEWDMPIGQMTRGCGCPYCHGLRVLKGFNDLETRYPALAKQWHPTKNGGLKPDMVTSGSGRRAFWLCPVCHQEWQAAINNRTANNRGCPYCTHQRPIKGINDLPTVRPDLMKEWDWGKNSGIDPSDMMENSNKTVWWRCQKCGFEYKSAISGRAKGTGCQKCAGRVLIPGENDLAALFPNIAAEWDYEANEDKKPSDVFPGSNKSVGWICRKGHKWKVSPNQRTRGHGCPYCSGNYVQIGFNDLSTIYPEIAAEWHPTMNGDLLPTQVSKAYSKKVWFKCPNCQSAYDSYIYNKTKGYGKCPYCNTKRKRKRETTG